MKSNKEIWIGFYIKALDEEMNENEACEYATEKTRDYWEAQIDYYRMMMKEQT